MTPQYPVPIADALVALEAAGNAHEQRDRVVEVFRALLRVMAALALAARVHRGAGPGSPSESLDKLLAKLRRQGLTDGEWVALTREILAPWARAPDEHPCPVLVRLFHASRSAGREDLDELLGMRKGETVAHGTTGDLEDVRAIVARRLPAVGRLLTTLDPLWSSLRLVVPLARGDGDPR